MKKWQLYGALIAICMTIAVGIYFLLTVPIIDRQEAKDMFWGGDSYVSGSTSHANVVYIDYRPVISKNAAAEWWWGDGSEWRRLESRSPGYTTTMAVLRDSASRFSNTGIERGSLPAKNLQRQYDEIRHAYEQQSIFDRVWESQVHR